VRARDVPARRAGSGSAGGGMGGSSGGALQQPLLDSLERRDSI